jgi:hypothetical protein
MATTKNKTSSKKATRTTKKAITHRVAKRKATPIRETVQVGGYKGEKNIKDNDSKILGMDKKTFGIVLSVGGGIFFTWATAQLASMPPDFVMPAELIAREQVWINFYHILQLVGVAAAIYGGVQTYKNFKER